MTMSNFTGMDIQAVRTLATQFQNKAAEIDGLRQQLTAQLDSTSWVGPDRDRFHNDWMGQYSTALNRVAEALREASQRATQNANEQEQASNS